MTWLCLGARGGWELHGKEILLCCKIIKDNTLHKTGASGIAGVYTGKDKR